MIEQKMALSGRAALLSTKLPPRCLLLSSSSHMVSQSHALTSYSQSAPQFNYSLHMHVIAVIPKHLILAHS
jgi:hypothetical protein